MMDELVLDYIAEGLRGLAVGIDAVHEDAANVRVGHAVERIAASLRQYGQRKPVVANRSQGGEGGGGEWDSGGGAVAGMEPRGGGVGGG